MPDTIQKDSQEKRLESIAVLLKNAYDGATGQLSPNDLLWFNLMILFIATLFAKMSGENNPPTQEMLRSFIAKLDGNHENQKKMLDHYQYLLNNRLNIYNNAKSNFLDYRWPTIFQDYHEGFIASNYISPARNWLNLNSKNAEQGVLEIMYVKDDARQNLMNALDKKLKRYQFFRDIFEIFRLEIPSIITDKIRDLGVLKNNLNDNKAESIKEIVDKGFRGALYQHTVGHLWKSKSDTGILIEKAIEKEQSLESHSFKPTSPKK